MTQNLYSDLLLDQTKDLIWAVDKDLYLVYANRAYLNLMKDVTGVEKELKTPILVEGFGEDYIATWKAYYQRALSGEYFEIEEHFYNPETKEMQYGHVAFSPIRDEGNEISTVACRSTNINSIIKQKDHASQLMDASLDVFCTIDEDGKLVFVSAASADHWGYHPEELIGKPYRDMIVEEDLEKTDMVATEIMAGKEFKSFSNRFRKKNGDIAYNLWSARWDHDVKLMYCVARDAKEKIEEEQQLKLLEKVINSTSEPILITEAEPQGEPGPRIVYVNEAFTKMTGYTAEEVLGKNPRLLQGPETDYEELRKLGEKLRRWEPSEITILNYKKTGEPFWVNFAVSPVADEKGWYTHWISVQRDVTEQKKQEAEKELLSQISLSFNNVEELIPAANRLCENLYAFGKFDLIEFWCPNMEQTHIKRIGHSTQNQDFYELEPSGTLFKKNEGMPGKVWKKEKQLLWNKKEINKYFLRKKGASHLGLQAILGTPLTFNDELVGVLLIGTKREPNYLEQHTPVLNRLEKFIGSEINRKRLENDLGNVFDAIPEILCITNFEGRFLKINNAGCDLLGYASEEVLFHYLDEFTLKADKGKFEQKIKGLTKETSVFTFENRFLSRDGKVIWLSWNCTTALEEGLVYASAKNITTEVQLRELNAQAGSLAKIGSWEINLEKNTIFWSKVVHQLHETDPDSFILDLEMAINFYREDFRPDVMRSIEKSISTGEGFDFEAVIVTKKLKERWIRAIGNVEMVHGKAIRIYGSFQDINDRKESELRLQSFANNLPGVAFQYYIYPDGTDDLKYVTTGAQDVWGFEAESVMKDNNLVWDQISLGGEIDTVKKSIMNSAETKSDWKAQWRYIMPTNELRIHAGYGSPTFLPDKTIVFNSLILDITQEHKSEELLEQASEMAKIGSWEHNLVEQENDSMYWSPMTREILEVDDSYNPSLTGGFEFYSGEDRERIQRAVDQLIEKGREFDLELLIITQLGKEKWIRCIGKCERVNNKCTKIYGSYQDIHAAKSNELRLKEILDSISDAFYAVDADWNFTYFNREAENLLKKSSDEVLGGNIWEIFSPAKGTILEEVYRRVASTGQSENFEYHYPGDGCWYEITTYPSGGGVSVYFKNIDARRNAAQKLKKAYNEKDEILERIGDAFFALDEHWNVIYWNKRAEEIIGIPKEELIGNNLWEIFPLAKELEFFKQYERAFKTQTPVNFEEYFQPFNQWYEANGYPSPEGISVFFRDITEKKLAQAKVIEANERFEIITKATNDAIWDYNIVENTLFWGDGFKTLFGYEIEKTTPTLETWTSHIHPDDVDRVERSVFESINNKNGTIWEEEYQYEKADGTYAFVFDKGIIIRDQEGKAVRMLGAMSDFSQLKKQEAELLEINESLKIYANELERSNEELEQFAFITSHDLQEPLRMISSFMDQLRRKYSDQLDDKALQYIHFATDGAKRMKQIILDLLLYSRANKPSEQTEEVNMNEIVAEYTQLRRKLIAEKNASIKFDALPILEVNRAPITQILHCLLDNALKYVKENVSPRIEIHAKEKESLWEFAVKDNGIGIDEKFHDKIFIIFQRLHNRKQDDGTGIGLSIAKRSVEFLGGEIWVESTLGKGSTFYFTIPKNK